MPLRAPFEPHPPPGGGEGEGADWFLNDRSDGLASGPLGGSWRVERGGEGEVEYLEREIQKVREEGRVKLETGVCVCVCVYVCLCVCEGRF